MPTSRLACEWRLLSWRALAVGLGVIGLPLLLGRLRRELLEIPDGEGALVARLAVVALGWTGWISRLRLCPGNLPRGQRNPRVSPADESVRCKKDCKKDVIEVLSRNLAKCPMSQHVALRRRPHPDQRLPRGDMCDVGRFNVNTLSEEIPGRGEIRPV